MNDSAKDETPEDSSEGGGLHKCMFLHVLFAFLVNKLIITPQFIFLYTEVRRNGLKNNQTIYGS